MREDDRRLALRFDMFGLGPVAHIDHASDSALLVTVDEDAPEKAAALAKWASLLLDVDLIAGQYDSQDPYLRLHVRGHDEHSPVVATAWFHVATEAGLCHLIRQRIDATDPHSLLDELANTETVHSSRQPR